MTTLTHSAVSAVATALAAAPGDQHVESRMFYKHLRTWERGGWQHSKVPLVQRLMNRVVFGSSECWHFCGTRNQFGYGRITVNGRMQVTHRLSYQLFVGPIPEGLSVLHTCDNPSCINPDHLWLGTYRDNSLDCLRKGRNPMVAWLRALSAQRRGVQ